MIGWYEDQPANLEFCIIGRIDRTNRLLRHLTFRPLDRPCCLLISYTFFFPSQMRPAVRARTHTSPIWRSGHISCLFSLLKIYLFTLFLICFVILSSDLFVNLFESILYLFSLLI